jgi:hypothetical protein
VDRKQVIVCPHGDQTKYKHFQWTHVEEDMVCNVLGSSRYPDVASRYHGRKSVQEAILEPDYPWLVTPEGIEAVCEWLSEGEDANVQFQRMVMLVKSSVFIVLGSTLRVRVPLLQRNLRYLTREGFMTDVKWLRIKLPQPTRKKYVMADFFKHCPNPKTNEAIQNVYDAMQKYRSGVEEKSKAAAQAMHQRNTLREV